MTTTATPQIARVLEPKHSGLRKDYDPGRCRADGCRQEGRWKGYCLTHYTIHQREERTMAGEIPLEKFKEVVGRVQTSREAAAELGITESGVSSRCRTNSIPTPAQRLGKRKKPSVRRKPRTEKGQLPPTKPEPKAEPPAQISSETAPVPAPVSQAPANPLASLQAEVGAMQTILAALQGLDGQSQHRVVTWLAQSVGLEQDKNAA